MLTPCPICSGISTIPIAYGKPSALLENAASRGLVEIGGCITGEGSPTMRCLDCYYGWVMNDVCSDHSKSDAALQEIKEIVEKHLHEVYAGMISSVLFSERREDWGAISSYLRLKTILGIKRGCTEEQVDAVLEFKELHPGRFNRIVEEFEHQVCVLSLSHRWPDGLHGALFAATALIFNASPMSCRNVDFEQIDTFECAIQRGWIGFE